MFGVQKSRPARPAFPNALASAPMAVPTASTSASSKAAAMVMGLGKDVAEENSPASAKWTPGEKATPWRASLHQSYLGSPSLSAPRLWLEVVSRNGVNGMFSSLHEIYKLLSNSHGIHQTCCS